MTSFGTSSSPSRSLPRTPVWLEACSDSSKAIAAGYVHHRHVGADHRDRGHRRSGTLVGPLFGAIVYIYLSQVLQNFSAVAGLWKLVLGVVFVLLITGFRRGIAGGASTFWFQYMRREPAPAVNGE